MRIPREVSWAASNSTGTLNPFLRRPSEKLGRKRYVLPVTSDGADRDLVSYKSGDEGSSPPPRPSRRGLPGSRVACRHRRGSHRCLVLPGALDIRAPRHAARLRAEFGKHPPVLWRKAGPRGTSVCSRRMEHWRRVFRSMRFHSALLGRVFREARSIERFCGTGEAPQVLYTASRIRVKASEGSHVGIERRVCGVRQGVAWGAHSTGRREVRRGKANLERDDRSQTRGDCAVQGRGRRDPIDRLRKGAWIRLCRPRRWTQCCGG